MADIDDAIAVDPILDALRLASDALEPSLGRDDAALGGQLAAERAAHAAVNKAIAYHLVTIGRGVMLGTRMREELAATEGDKSRLSSAVNELLDRLPPPTRN